MKYITTLILILSSFSAFCAFRPILIAKELKTASFVGEIKFIGYDSIHVSLYSDYHQLVKIDTVTHKEEIVHSTDSIWVISRIYYKKVGIGNDSTFSVELLRSYFRFSYKPLADSLPTKVSNGFWPRVNDTCLIVIDSKENVSLFASIENDNYVFWDPYPNSSWYSVFVFDDFFECYSTDGRNSSKSSNSMRVADFYKMKYACGYHCFIKRKTMWEEIVNKKT